MKNKNDYTHKGQYEWIAKFFKSFRTKAEKMRTSSSDQPRALWNSRIIRPSILLWRLYVSQDPTNLRRGSRGHGPEGNFTTLSVTLMKPRASNCSRQRVGSSTGVPKTSHASRSLFENFRILESGAMVSSSHWMMPVTHWNSTQPPGLR